MKLEKTTSFWVSVALAYIVEYYWFVIVFILHVYMLVYCLYKERLCCLLYYEINSWNSYLSFLQRIDTNNKSPTRWDDLSNNYRSSRPNLNLAIQYTSSHIRPTWSPDARQNSLIVFQGCSRFQRTIPFNIGSTSLTKCSRDLYSCSICSIYPC